MEEAWTIVVPLVEADGGEIYLVRKTSTEMHLHLAGSCAGCPGATLTEQHLLAPVIRKFFPETKLKLTAGWIIPSGASRLRPGDDDAITGEEATLAMDSRPR